MDDYKALTDSDSSEMKKLLRVKRSRKCPMFVGLLIICVLGLVFVTLVRYFTMPWHASCQVKFSWKNSGCDTINQEIVDQVKNWTGRENCLNGGQKCLYNLLWNRPDFINATHTTPVKGYVDTLSFNFKQEDSTCVVDGYSSSNLWYAILDYGTNYCNLKNLILGSNLDQQDGYLEETSDSICTQYSSANCEIY